MKNKNEYKVRENVIKEKGVNRFIEKYYTIVRLERYFFDLIGPYVWKEYFEFETFSNPFYNHYVLYKSSNYDDAVRFCNKLNNKYEIEIDQTIVY
jgi:hypothetical protein